MQCRIDDIQMREQGWSNLSKKSLIVWNEFTVGSLKKWEERERNEIQDKNNMISNIIYCYIIIYSNFMVWYKKQNLNTLSSLEIWPETEKS